MLPITGGDAAKEALANGAYQTATLVVYDAGDSEHGYPQLISFDNENIVQGSLTVTKSGVQGDRLEYGAVISDELRVRVRKPSILTTTLLGQMITLCVEWDYDDETYGTMSQALYPFSGIITEAKWLGEDIYQIVALDSLIVLDKPFHLSELIDPTITPATHPLTYPVTLKNLVWSIGISVGAPYISNVGVSYPSDPLPNENATISSIDETQGYTYRDILRYCAQLMRANITVTPDPTHQIKVSPLVRLYYTAEELSYNDFYKVTCTQQPPTVWDANYHINIASNNEVIYEYPAGKREILISDNPLVTQAAESLGGITTLGDNLNNNLQYSLAFPTLTLGFAGSSNSLWYLEPFDFAAVTGLNGNTGVTGSNIVLTGVVHKLNGASVLEAKVQPETMTLKQVIPFNQQQTAKLTEMANTLNDSLADTNADVATLQSHDYIVEQGTSGIWAYRKWNSGVSECWGTASGNITMSTLGSQYGIGGLFYNATAGSDWDISFPTSLFNATPVATATANTGVNTLVTLNSLSSSGFLPRFWTAFTQSSTVTMNLKIHAIGRWKN